MHLRLPEGELVVALLQVWRVTEYGVTQKVDWGCALVLPKLSKITQVLTLTCWMVDKYLNKELVCSSFTQTLHLASLSLECLSCLFTTASLIQIVKGPKWNLLSEPIPKINTVLGCFSVIQLCQESSKILFDSSEKEHLFEGVLSGAQRNKIVWSIGGWDAFMLSSVKQQR